jgi:CO/xanthine dehydrogenase FAD-binding subunit
MERVYFEPSSTDEALTLLQEHQGIDVVAGGTDLVVGDRNGKRELGSALLAIHRLRELAGITARDDGGFRVGSLVTHAELEHDERIRERLSALADSAALVGSPATRNAGTLGGNLANASPAMETGSPLLCYDASVELTSREGARTIPLSEFLVGPGKTARASGELVTAADVPPLPSGEVGSAYVRLEYRQAMEIAVVGAAALVALDAGGRIVEGRLALTAVAPVCLRVPDAERLLADQPADADVLRRAAAATADAAAPIDDVRASARYRRAMVPVIARRALELALRRARGERLPVPAAHALTHGGLL